MKVAIITGISKGLGYSLARLLLQAEIHVIGISRHNNKALEKLAEENNVNYSYYSCDLSNLETMNETLQVIEKHVCHHNIKTLYIINNAAVLTPIQQASKISSEELTYHYQVNTIAPMVIINYFLQAMENTRTTIYGVTITSGAAERPIYGWSAYGSSKASMNMYTKTVALEQAALQTGNKIIAFSPGIMDTEMQQTIRMSDPTAFQDVDTFRHYKKNDQLQDPQIVGEILVNILLNETGIKNGHIYYVHDYLKNR